MINSILEFLPHIYSLLGIIIPLYCYIIVRRPKFIVFKKKESRILVENSNNLPIRFKNDIIISNLYYYRYLICYVGANDTKQEDVEIPLTFSHQDANCEFKTYRILSQSCHFNPSISFNKKSLIIESKYIKDGDAIDIAFVIDAKNSYLQLKQRIFNVNSNIEYYQEKDNIKTNILGWVVGLISSIFIVNIALDTIKNRHQFKDEYNVEYIFQGYRVAEDFQHRTNSKVDSLFNDAFFRKQDMYKDLIKHPEIDSNVKENFNEELLRLNKNLINLKDELDSKTKQLDSLDKVKPSILADSIFKSLKQKNKVEFDKELIINNDLKITFVNPKKESITFILFNGIGLILVFALSLIAILNIVTLGIELYYTNKLKNFLK